MENKVWVIWISNETQSSIVGTSSTLEKAIDRAVNLGAKLEFKHIQRDGTVDIRVNRDTYIFLVPTVLDGEDLDFDTTVYGNG